MPDCHAFCKDMSQAIDEFRKRFDLSREVLSGLGIEENDYEVVSDLLRIFTMKIKS